MFRALKQGNLYQDTLSLNNDQLYILCQLKPAPDICAIILFMYGAWLAAFFKPNLQVGIAQTNILIYHALYGQF